MKMINNYLASLETYLPSELKQEVRGELEASIMGAVEDEEERLGHSLNEQEQEAMLKGMGHPMCVASTYLPNQQLISARYFPAFKQSLKTTLTLVLTIQFLTQVPSILSGDNLIGSAWVAIGSLPSTGLLVFAALTLVFYAMQTSGVNIEEIYAWSPRDIKDSGQKLSISRVDAGFGFAIGVFFLAWWNGFVPAFSVQDDSGNAVRLSSEWSAVLVSVNIVCGLGILLNLYKFALAGWNKVSLAANVVLNLASLVILYQIGQFEQFAIFPEAMGGAQVFETTVTIVLSVIAIITVWDTISCIRKLATRNAD